MRHRRFAGRLPRVREPYGTSGLRYKFVELLHKTHSHFESAKFVWCHGVGVEVHDVITNLSDIVKQFGKNNTINSQIELSPYLWILEQPNILTEC